MNPWVRARSHPWLAALAISTVVSWSGCSSPTDAPTQNPPKSTSTSERPKTAKPSSYLAQKLLEAGKFDEAFDECQRVFIGTPDDARSLMVAATVLHQRNKVDNALKLIDRIAIANPEYGLKGSMLAAQWSWERKDLLETERRCKAVRERYPDQIEPLTMLAACLDFQGRRFEAAALHRELIRLGKFSMVNLILAIDTVKPLESDVATEKLASERPNEPLIRSSIGFGHLHEHRAQQAEEVFRSIIAKTSAPPAIGVGLGVALIDQEKYESIPGWFASLPSGADQLPGYWRVLGLWYQSQEQHESAVFCLTRSAELDPFDYLSLGPLAQSLAILGRIDQSAAAESLFQSHQLTNRNVNYTRDGFRKPEWMLQIATALETSGRTIEGKAWRELCEISNENNPNKIVDLQRQRMAIAQTISITTAGTTGFQWNTHTMSPPSLDAIRSTAIAQPGLVNKPASSSDKALIATVRLTDQAAMRGIQAGYLNGDDPDKPGMQTYQSNGGGAAAIDFDQDGWSDLFLLQGGGDPRSPLSNQPCSLIRSRFGESFVNVASVAHVENRAYGQGAAVGDWDQDGFPDLFILNFGQNRLLKNMGDGTFADILVPAMKRDIQNAPVWSVSGAIADIDGDHLPDLLEINYSSGIDVITHFCYGVDKEVQVCRPTEFPSSPDYIYLNDGQGGFQLANDVWHLPLDDGRGLGVIVANLDGLHGNDIYIANDMSANNLLISAPNPTGTGFIVRDEAVRRGCAVDFQGKPQASMGVGCADVDRNGYLDLFMTNFLNEYNALYLQSSNHSFQDASRRYGFTDNDKSTLGFGTQLFDLDLDGWHDAIIVNGHVEDYTKLGQPFKMKPQILLQRDRKFVDQASDALGPYFTRSCLARSLGIVDFDHDGRADFFVTHLDQPFALLRNETLSNGRWLMVELIGTQSERDAIGAQITVRCGEQQWTHQMIAGNGFECSNERFVHFGLGTDDQPIDLEVHWPSGLRQTWMGIEADHRILLIEGSESVDIRY